RLPVTLSTVATAAPGVGGADWIDPGAGDGVVFGGTGADLLTLGSGTTLAVGDDGAVVWNADGNPLDIDSVFSTTPGDGGDDTIDGGTGLAVVLGDDGAILESTAPGAPFGGLPIVLGTVRTIDDTPGGDDVIATAAASAFVLGGGGSDTITLGSGTNLVLGD